MNLIVDRGNTSTKVAIFDQQQLVEKRVFQHNDDVEQFLKQSSADNFMVSSVKGDAKIFMEWAENAKHKFILTSDLPVPIINQYTTPNTLGVDRLAGVCGAYQLFPGQHCLVIDAGTCITYDFIDDSRQYKGGSISPGLSMRFQAIHTFTARLPLIQPIENPSLTGNSTESCIQSGIVNGMIEEINGIIARYFILYKPLKVVLCGGDGPFFENNLKAPIFACPNLVLIGLNSILIHNVSHS